MLHVRKRFLLGHSFAQLFLNSYKLIMFFRLIVCSFLVAVAESNAPFLKEIIQGRCYDTPPTESIDDCAAVVGGIMGVLESHVDADIASGSFDMALDQMILTPPKDQALVYLISSSSSSESIDGKWTQVTAPEGLVRPEDTPGGSLLDGLVFCGIDQAQNCKKEESNAYWKYWSSVYSRFAMGVQGHFHMALEPYSDANFVKTTIIQHLVQDQVSAVTLYGPDCTAKSILQVQNALVEAGYPDDDIMCVDNLGMFTLCAADPDSMDCKIYQNETTSCQLPEATTDAEDTSENTDSNEDETENESKPKGSAGGFLILLAVICFLVYSCVKERPRAQKEEPPASKQMKSSNDDGTERQGLLQDAEAALTLFLNPAQQDGMETVVVQ